MLTTIDVDRSVRCSIRECWVLANNFRISAHWPGWTQEPTIHTLVLEWVEVEEEHRRQGHLKRLIETMIAIPTFDMVIVEGVQNPILAEALMRWGWEVDPQTMDFHLKRSSLGDRQTQVT